MIGRYCLNVGTFHLDVWNEDIEDAHVLAAANLNECFTNLQENIIISTVFYNYLDVNGVNDSTYF